MTDAILLHLVLRREQDVFAVRQRGREAAAALGLEHQDQIRVATALSDVGRQLLAKAAGVEVTFRVHGRPESLRIDLAVPGPVDPQALRPAGRLVDVLEVADDGHETVVMLSRRLPAPDLLTADQVERARRTLATSTVASPLDELSSQNEHLLSALEEAREQRDRLKALNDELEETNRGVMALYLQLSSELEETNRGVVALYAELDEKSGQLRAASEAKTRFLANVSHELRAPVTAVIGLIRLLSDPASDPLTAAQAEQIALMRGSASDLLSLVNDLLDLAKAESGHLEPGWAPVDLSQLFKQLRGTLRAVLTNPDVELIVDTPDDGAWIESDEALLTQVLRNLLHNAVKFTEQGQVTMHARCDGRRWTITVADTGIGIPAAQHERIFEEFVQLPGRQKIHGTGLGLPYARRLVGILGGDMAMVSEPGKGSTFTVTLPVARIS
ncbi:sensor histidine kinase [Catellatospora citrea]|uniref:histidine kinase n=1 Tax=Catellatospora citrea TaxID=53366 RepID=A0A8J3KCQ4_9ACTN|nr:sensor histidine kinase [Catellatospora citrea]RKE06194.1 signal transduction histidine kinase [Catellatospora citrea]GIG00533.1 sensor histidine kinase [Catellatospora citrea]